MSIASYSDLTNSVASWLHRADLNSQVSDFITLAESRINNDLRHRAMETTTASTIAAGVIAVPDNYIELKDAYISSTSPYVNLDRKTSNWIYDKYPYRSSDNLPKFIAREGSSFIFGPYPDTNYVVTLVYYNRFSPIASATNSVFLSYPGLWLYGALLEASPYLKNDARIAVWEAKFSQLFSLVQKESDDEYLSGAVPQIVQG